MALLRLWGLLLKEFVISSNVDKTDCKMIFILKHLNVKKLRNYIADAHVNHDTLA